MTLQQVPAVLFSSCLRMRQLGPRWCRRQLLSTVTNKDYDIVVAGGGMVGAAQAAALASRPELAGCRLALLEAGKPLAQTQTQVLEKIGEYVPVSAATSSRQYPSSIVGVSAGSRAAFPLGVGHARHYVSPRCALVGDAAHRVHPMAGLGVNLGFGDVAALTRHVSDGLYDGGRVGALDALLEYESGRQAKVVPTMIGIDLLYRLYSNGIIPLALIRSLGLNTVHNWNWLKGKIMQHAAA